MGCLLVCASWAEPFLGDGLLSEAQGLRPGGVPGGLLGE